MPINKQRAKTIESPLAVLSIVVSKKIERGEKMVDLDGFKTRWNEYKTPLAELRDSL